MTVNTSTWFKISVATLVGLTSIISCKSTTNVNNSDMLATRTSSKTLTGTQAENLYLALKEYGLEELNAFQYLQITAKSISCESKSSCNITTKNRHYQKPVELNSKAAETIYNLIEKEQITTVDCKQSLTPGRSGYECTYTPNSSQSPSEPASDSSKYVDILDTDIKPFFDVLSKLPNADSVTSNGVYLNIKRISCKSANDCSVTTANGTSFTKDPDATRLIYDALAHALKINDATGGIDIGTGNCSQDVTRDLYKCKFSMLLATKKGACVLVCEGKDVSCVNADEQRCVESKKNDVFNNTIPRCIHSIVFRAGQSCPN